MESDRLPIPDDRGFSFERNCVLCPVSPKETVAWASLEVGGTGHGRVWPWVSSDVGEFGGGRVCTWLHLGVGEFRRGRIWT